MTWHRLTHPEHPAPVWTESLEGYADWTVTARTDRPPGDHEDHIGGTWVVDHENRAVAARRRHLRSMQPEQLVDHIVDEVIARLAARGLKID